MRKSFILISLLTITWFAQAQSLDDIGGMMDKSKFADAKNAIEKYLADPKNANSSDGWYYKGRIYNSLSRDAAVSKADALSYKQNAFDAFKKNQALDKKDFRMITEQYTSYLDLYLGFYDLGAQLFNDKNYNSAYNTFIKAQEVENFILAKNYTYKEIQLNKLDTGLVMNTASAAVLLGDSVNAVKNYTRIIDAKIAGAEYERVYEFLATYYKVKKDEANMQAIITKGRAAYPASNFWNEFELQALSENTDKTAMFAKYEELFIKDPSNFNNNYNYGVELYNSIYEKDFKNVNTDRADKLTQVLKAAIATDKGNDANMLMTNHLYNYAADYSSRAALIKEGKLAKPADIKTKKDLNVLANAKMDELIPFAEKGIKFYSEQKELKNRAKVNYQLLAGYLADIYRVKANVKKADEYDKLKASIKF